MSPSTPIRLILALVLLAAPAGASIAITLVTGLDAGSALPTASPGTLTLALSPIPTGTRTVSGGTLLGGSPSFNLGAFRITGPALDAWTVAPASPTLTLTKGADTLTVATSSVTLAPGASGVLPANGDSGPLYLGLTVQVGNSLASPAGLYTGNLELTAQDITAGGAPVSLFLPVAVKVDPTPIALQKTADLAFGNILAGATAGTVVLAPEGTRTAGGGATALAGSFSAAAFIVSGSPSALYAIVLPAGPVPLNSGGSSVDAVAFTSTPALKGALDPLGQQSLSVGATLNVGANQPPGTYTGTFQVTVLYQ
jgi:hypothetical protein